MDPVQSMMLFADIIEACLGHVALVANNTNTRGITTFNDNASVQEQEKRVSILTAAPQRQWHYCGLLSVREETTCM